MKHEPLPLFPANSLCKICGGRGFNYIEGWAETCDCRYDKNRYYPELLKTPPKEYLSS